MNEPSDDQLGERSCWYWIISNCTFSCCVRVSEPNCNCKTDNYFMIRSATFQWALPALSVGHGMMRGCQPLDARRQAWAWLKRCVAFGLHADCSADRSMAWDTRGIMGRSKWWWMLFGSGWQTIDRCRLAIAFSLLGKFRRKASQREEKLPFLWPAASVELERERAFVFVDFIQVHTLQWTKLDWQCGWYYIHLKRTLFFISYLPHFKM